MEVLLGTPPDRLYLAMTRRMRAAGGRDLGRILVLEDVTKERETDKIKNDFVSVIGHELRTPLTVVKGYVKMLSMKGSSIDEASLETCVKALTNNTGRLERLIEAQHAALRILCRPRFRALTRGKEVAELAYRGPEAGP
jgi:signal transduction histidine kinase